ncbi:FAD-dependent oxidoreductase [Pseudomonas typographi]|uniref:oxidoreductase n=1 Tax=Pseudomonas typographi TaxID=2715964 RepID=UPI001684A312|nr:FAD-dependent oxidoreductase [Pseudomonas typographi]MBD1552294.1 FAD-dependent oxidoreductase [Pseudomonas typographi]MBD1587414.1 FAD-dependent oxidoreductase [Pseudomonas typographi]
MASTNDPLLQPFTLKHLHLRNRVVSTSHEPAYSEGGMPRARYRLYHEEKAKGGVALTMIGGSSIVAADSPPAFGNLHLYKDEVVPWLRELADGVHQHGSAVMCQLSHLGWRASNFSDDWLPLMWPQRGREHAHRSFTKQMEDWDITRIVRQYAEAAQRCQAAGLDGVEIEAYGHLFDAFWSPGNRREDGYGGDLEGRVRFPLQVLAAMRKAVGPGFIIGVRMAVDEAMPGGLSEQEGLTIARTLADHGMDFISVIKGRIDSGEALARVIPGMGTPAGPHLELAGAVRRTVPVPVMHAARISDVATARHALREGLVDLVGLTRPHMADPYLLAKVAAGQEQRIRPCVGASYCIDRIYISGEAHCIHNPATGREARIPQLTPPSPAPGKHVVVVGAGPAGLEAARVCAERGHRVSVLEAASHAGGQVRVAAAPLRRRELIGVVDWRLAECERLGVSFRYHCYAEANDVLALAPDVVIIATGGIPDCEFLEEGNALVHSSWDVLTGDFTPQGSVLVFDGNGGHQAMSCAETLAQMPGVSVQLVTGETSLGPDVGGLNMPAYLKVFVAHGVQQTFSQRLVGVRAAGSQKLARLWCEATGEHYERRVDHVVVEHGTLPMDELYFALKGLSRNRGELDHEAFIGIREQQVNTQPEARFQLFRIGDAVASRDIHAAIYDGLRLSLAI